MVRLKLLQPKLLRINLMVIRIINQKRVILEIMMERNNIKQLKPRLKRFKQGYIKGCKKYFGPGPIIYRSSWERKFVYWLEGCNNVIRWTSENIAIKYVWIDGKVHTYYPDYYVEMRNGKRLVIEVKPYSQTQQPINENAYNIREWTKNCCKWKAAREFCAQNGLEFQIITERTINKL